ncbi:hypothetical protein [Rhodopseudomonas sp. BR0C11]|uniref:hypothetical protein n=1 Tax=Rhodopseudomonas sp. BR0C11 TaxID=2269370 RepID=UPI00196852A8|nr:hypothetical protein [Rhodopseudomonas sp. BR0C11]
MIPAAPASFVLLNLPGGDPEERRVALGQHAEQQALFSHVDFREARGMLFDVPRI